MSHEWMRINEDGKYAGIYNYYRCKRCQTVGWRERNEVGKYWRKIDLRIRTFGIGCKETMMRRALG